MLAIRWCHTFLFTSRQNKNIRRKGICLYFVTPCALLMVSWENCKCKMQPYQRWPQPRWWLAGQGPPRASCRFTGTRLPAIVDAWLFFGDEFEIRINILRKMTRRERKCLSRREVERVLEWKTERKRNSHRAKQKRSDLANTEIWVYTFQVGGHLVKQK